MLLPNLCALRAGKAENGGEAGIVDQPVACGGDWSRLSIAGLLLAMFDLNRNAEFYNRYDAIDALSLFRQCQEWMNGTDVRSVRHDPLETKLKPHGNNANAC